MFKMFKRFVSRNSNRNICVQSKFLVEEVRSGTFEGRQVQFVYHATKSLNTSGTKTIREPWLLQIKNKDLDTLWISMQIM